MPVPERFGVTLEYGDLVEVTITGRIESMGAKGLYLAHDAADTIGTVPFCVMSSIVNLTPPPTPAPDAHLFEAGDLVASDTDLPRPYVRTRQADGSWLTPKGFRSSVTDAYMSARIEAGDFWRVDTTNPDAAVEYTLADAPTCGTVSGGRLTMTSGARLEDWERELLSSPALVVLPEVGGRFKVGTDYYHPMYPNTHYTREAGGWRSHEIRFSTTPRFFADDSPRLTQAWVAGLLPVAS